MAGDNVRCDTLSPRDTGASKRLPWTDSSTTANDLVRSLANRDCQADIDLRASQEDLGADRLAAAQQPSRRFGPSAVLAKQIQRYSLRPSADGSPASTVTAHRSPPATAACRAARSGAQRPSSANPSPRTEGSLPAARQAVGSRAASPSHPQPSRHSQTRNCSAAQCSSSNNSPAVYRPTTSHSPAGPPRPPHAPGPRPSPPSHSTLNPTSCPAQPRRTSFPGAPGPNGSPSNPTYHTPHHTPQHHHHHVPTSSHASPWSSRATPGSAPRATPSYLQSRDGQLPHSAPRGLAAVRLAAQQSTAGGLHQQGAGGGRRASPSGGGAGAGAAAGGEVVVAVPAPCLALTMDALLEAEEVVRLMVARAVEQVEGERAGAQGRGPSARRSGAGEVQDGTEAGVNEQEGLQRCASPGCGCCVM